MRTAGFAASFAEYQGIDLWQYLSITFESIFKRLPADAGMMAVARQNLRMGKPTILWSKPEYQRATILYSLLAKAQGTLVVSGQREWSAGYRISTMPSIAVDSYGTVFVAYASTTETFDNRT